MSQDYKHKVCYRKILFAKAGKVTFVFLKTDKMIFQSKSPWQKGSTRQVNKIWPNGWLHMLQNKEYYLVSWSPVGGSIVSLGPKPLNIDTCMN